MFLFRIDIVSASGANRTSLRHIDFIGPVREILVTKWSPMIVGAMDVRRVVTSEPSHMTSGPTSAELHPVYPSPHAVNPTAAAIGIAVSEPQTAFRPVAKRSV